MSRQRPCPFPSPAALHRDPHCRTANVNGNCIWVTQYSQYSFSIYIYLLVTLCDSRQQNTFQLKIYKKKQSCDSTATTFSITQPIVVIIVIIVVLIVVFIVVVVVAGAGRRHRRRRLVMCKYNSVNIDPTLPLATELQTQAANSSSSVDLRSPPPKSPLLQAFPSDHAPEHLNIFPSYIIQSLIVDIVGSYHHLFVSIFNGVYVNCF